MRSLGALGFEILLHVLERGLILGLIANDLAAELLGLQQEISVVNQADLEPDDNKEREGHIEHASQHHAHLPHRELEVVDLVAAVERQHLVHGLLEPVLRSKYVVLVRHEHVARRVVRHGGVYFVRACPHLGDDAVEDSAVQQIVHIEVTQIPEHIMALVVLHLDHIPHLSWLGVRVHCCGEYFEDVLVYHGLHAR